MLNRIKNTVTRIASSVSSTISSLFGFNTQLVTVEEAQINIVVQIALAALFFSIGLQFTGMLFAICAAINTTNLILFYTAR